jgi:hypothetical protein
MAVPMDAVDPQVILIFDHFWTVVLCVSSYNFALLSANVLVNL